MNFKVGDFVACTSKDPRWDGMIGKVTNVEQGAISVLYYCERAIEYWSEPQIYIENKNTIRRLTPLEETLL
jgi:hypothetical protein